MICPVNGTCPQLSSCMCLGLQWRICCVPGWCLFSSIYWCLFCSFDPALGGTWLGTCPTICTLQNSLQPNHLRRRLRRWTTGFCPCSLEKSMGNSFYWTFWWWPGKVTNILILQWHADKCWQVCFQQHSQCMQIWKQRAFAHSRQYSLYRLSHQRTTQLPPSYLLSSVIALTTTRSLFYHNKHTRNTLLLDSRHKILRDLHWTQYVQRLEQHRAWHIHNYIWYPSLRFYMMRKLLHQNSLEVIGPVSFQHALRQGQVAGSMSSLC